MADFDLQALIKDALEEDLGPQHSDITSAATIPQDKQATAVIRAREDGIIAGVEIAKSVFLQVDPTLKITLHAHDGDLVSSSDQILEVTGNARAILLAERTALNLISHLSGIASTTRAYVDAVADTPAQIYDTRKTLPGLRALQKAAVIAGGGHNHRYGLHDAILIKDNHIVVAGSIETALGKALEHKENAEFIEIEVDTIPQLEEVITFCDRYGEGVDIVLLDNMSVENLEKAVSMTQGRFVLEASGGVNLQTVKDIAQTGVERISVGALTHSVKVFDLGLDIDIR